MKTNLMLLLEAAGAALAGGSVGVLDKAETTTGQATSGDAKTLGILNHAMKTAESAFNKSETDVYDRLGPSDTFESVTDEELVELSQDYLEMLRKAKTTRKEIAALPPNTRAAGGATIHDVLLVRYTGKIDRDGRTRTSTKDAAARIAKSWIVRKK